MGKYLLMIGVCINLIYTIVNRFVWEIPNRIAFPVLIVGVVCVLIGAVWGKPIKEAVLTLGICAVITLVGMFLAHKFIK